MRSRKILSGTRFVRMIALVAASCIAAAPAIAGQGSMTVQPPPAKPAGQAPTPGPYPVYPLPAWVHPNEVRCEQDRLLTDTSPCGPTTGQPEAVGRAPNGTVVLVPDRPKRCEQDRLITDDTPCTR